MLRSPLNGILQRCFGYIHVQMQKQEKNTFWVPFGVVDLFTQKHGRNGGEYRHTLAHRVYLYALHYCAGRFRHCDRKRLVMALGTSTGAFERALDHLTEIGLARRSRNYTEFVGQTRIKSKWNIRFQFTYEELCNPQSFKNKLFRCQMQTIAAMYGQKKHKRNLFPQRKNDHTVNERCEFIQKQSASYIAKIAGISHRGAQERLKRIRVEQTPELEWGYRTSDYRGFGTMYHKDEIALNDLTTDGHKPKVKSKIRRFHTKAEAEAVKLELNNPKTIIAQKGTTFGVFTVEAITWKLSIPCKALDQSKDLFWKLIKPLETK